MAETSDYISRNEIFSVWRSMPKPASISSLTEAINRTPAADVEPVRHGRWEGYTHSRYCGMDEYGDPIYRDGTVYYCFNPKCRRKTVVKEKFCPSCGTKMNLEEDSFEV